MTSANGAGTLRSRRWAGDEDDEIDRISRKAPRFDELWLSGGEPFLWDDLVELIALFHGRNGVKAINYDVGEVMRSRALRDEVAAIGGGAGANCWCTHSCWIVSSMQFSPKALAWRIPLAQASALTAALGGAR